MILDYYMYKIMLQINSLVFNFSTSATEKNEKTVVLWDGKFHLILSKLTLIEE